MEQAVAAHYERVSASPSFKAVAQFWHLLVNVVEDIAYAVVMLAIVIWLRVTLFYRTVFADIDVDGSALRFDAAVHRVDVGTQAGEVWVLGSDARFPDVNGTPTTTSTPSASRLSSVIPSKAASPVPSGKGVKPIPTQSPKPASDKPIAALIVRIRDNDEVLEKLRAVQNSLVDMDGRFFDHLEAENSFLIPLLRLRIDRDSVPLIEEAIRTCVSALTKPLTVAIRGVYHDADDGHLYGGIPQGQNEVLCPLRKFVGKFVNIFALTTSLASKRFQVLPEPLGKDWHRVMLARLESAEQRRVLGKYLTKISDQDKALGRVRVEDIEIVSSNSDGWRKEYGHAIKKVYLKSKAAFSSPNDFSTSTAVSQPDDNLDGVGLSTSALALKATNNGGFIPIIAVRVRSQEIAKAVEVFRSMALDQDQRLSPTCPT